MKVFTSSWITLLVVLLSLAPGVGCQPKSETPKLSETDIITLPDENLYAAIKEALGKLPGEEIVVAELYKFIELRGNSKGINDLSGLQYCTNFTVFSLMSNQISDISPRQISLA